MVDRFHVMKQLNSRMTQLLTETQKRAFPEAGSVIKGSRRVLVRNRSEPSLLEEEQLQKIVELCSEFGTLYLLKEEYRSIFVKIRCRQKAARFLSARDFKSMSTGNRYLTKFVTTLKNLWEEPLDFFMERVTNGFA